MAVSQRFYVGESSEQSDVRHYFAFVMLRSEDARIPTSFESVLFTFVQEPLKDVSVSRERCRYGGVPEEHVWEYLESHVEDIMCDCASLPVKINQDKEAFERMVRTQPAFRHKLGLLSKALSDHYGSEMDLEVFKMPVLRVLPMEFPESFGTVFPAGGDE